MREWREIHGQLHTLVMEFGLRPTRSRQIMMKSIARFWPDCWAILASRPRRMASILARAESSFPFFPGSVLKKPKPKWVVAAELTETTKLYARCVAKIDPLWVEKIAGRLCKKHYFDPHWEKRFRTGFGF